MRLKIKVSPDGKEVTGLYSDLFPWKKLGRLQVKRASDVFFDSVVQKWCIRLDASRVVPTMFCDVLPEKFDKRKDAIDYEIAYLQGRL